MTAVTFHCELALAEVGSDVGAGGAGDQAEAGTGDAVRHDVTISVEDGRIAAITAGSPAKHGATRLGGLTLPGFANAHSHAFHRALRGRVQAGTGSFWTWREVMYTVAGRLDPESSHRLARATYAEMALAGVTAVGEFHYLHHAPDGTPYAERNAMGEALLSAADDAGIRITLLDTLYLHGGLADGGYRCVTGPQRRYCDGDVERWIERVEALRPGPGQHVGAAIHSVRAVDPPSMAAAAAWAETRGAPLHVHLSEQPAENEQCLAAHGRTPTALLHDHGALGAGSTAVHATHLTDDDIGTLAATGTAVCLCPTTERDLGDGIGPSAELADAGVPLCLGTDSHAVIDLLEEARSLELHERLRSLRRGVHDPQLLLASATRQGHRALGCPDAGRIAVGHRADLVAVSLDSVRTAGATDDVALATALFAAGAHDVTDVVVGGEHIVEDGHHRSVDVAAELRSIIIGLLAP